MFVSENSYSLLSSVSSSSFSLYYCYLLVVRSYSLETFVIEFHSDFHFHGEQDDEEEEDFVFDEDNDGGGRPLKKQKLDPIGPDPPEEYYKNSWCANPCAVTMYSSYFITSYFIKINFSRTSRIQIA